MVLWAAEDGRNAMKIEIRECIGNNEARLS
jgi:hypothetical protein